MKIAVVAGGLSTERDVSFKTGSMVAEALRENGHQVILLDIFMGCREEEEELGDVFADPDSYSVQAEDIPEVAPDLAAVKASRKDQSDCFFGPNVIQICRKADIVFIGLHGANGEDGRVQAAFDLLGIKYTGSGYRGSAIAMNKELTKRFFESNGIPTPTGVTMTRETREDDPLKLPFPLPCVVKPCCGGSSIGVTIVREASDYRKALDDAFFWENELVIEEYVKGREFSVGVVEGKALPVIEIAPIEGFYNYKNKYKAGSAVETCPADIPDQVAKEMQRYAERAAEVVGLEVYSRSDFLLREDGRVFCLEVNTLPGMTATSLVPQEAAAVGVSYRELCERIIDLSIEKHQVKAFAQ